MMRVEGTTLWWGSWRLKAGATELVLYEAAQEVFVLPLASCVDAYAMVDTLDTIAAKPWCHNDIIAELTRAMCDILDPHKRFRRGHKPITHDESVEWIAQARSRLVK